MINPMAEVAPAPGGTTWYVFTGEASRSTGFTVDLNQWQHVAAVFEPGTGVRFYKNGVLATVPHLDIDWEYSLLSIGNRPGTTDRAFEGRDYRAKRSEHPPVHA